MKRKNNPSRRVVSSGGIGALFLSKISSNFNPTLESSIHRFSFHKTCKKKMKYVPLCCPVRTSTVFQSDPKSFTKTFVEAICGFARSLESVSIGSDVQYTIEV